MSAKHLVSLRSITKHLRDRRGDALLLGMFVILLIGALFIMFLELWRIISVTDEAQKKVTATLTSMAATHINDSYGPVRDGTSGAYVYSSSGFDEIKDNTSFCDVFTTLYPNASSFADGIKVLKSNGSLYEISDISITVFNATGGEIRSQYFIQYTLSIQQDFFWQDRTMILKNQKQHVSYKEKF